MKSGRSPKTRLWLSLSTARTDDRTELIVLKLIVLCVLNMVEVVALTEGMAVGVHMLPLVERSVGSLCRFLLHLPFLPPLTGE